MTPSSAPAVDPMSDPAVRKQVETGRQVAYHLLKGLKVIGMYRHNESKYSEYLTKAWQALTEYISEYGALQLKVEMTNFTIHKQGLFTEDSPLPYKFFRDGIRQIIFREGFSLSEMATFSLIALSDPGRGADEINAQLWRAQMPCFEYIMVEGFQIDTEDGDEVQVEVDKVVDYLQRRLRTHSEDFVRFARLSESDLELQMNDVEQMRGVVITGVTAAPDLKARLQREIHEEEDHRLFPKVLNAVLQVIENELGETSAMDAMFGQLLDAMLMQEDFAVINQVVVKLRAMAQRAIPNAVSAKLLEGFISKMGEEQRLNRIGEILKHAKLKNPPELIKYLINIPPTAVPALLGTLEVIELPENRVLLCDILVTFARQTPEPFVEKLRSTDKPQMERDMAYVLEKSNHPEKLKFLADILRTKNLALKLEVMGIIARSRTGEARNLIASLLEDETMQVRLEAARLLPEFDRERASSDLLRIIQNKKFEDRTPQEREGVYVALVSTGTPTAIAHLTELLAQKSGLFNKQKLITEKTLAVTSLGAACTIQTAKLLQEVIDDKAQPPEVISASRVQLSRVRKQLFGSAEKEG